MSQKNASFWAWMSRQDRVGFSNCLDLHMHYCCAAVSASNFQVLICNGWRNSTLESFIRFLDDPARMICILILTYADLTFLFLFEVYDLFQVLLVIGVYYLLPVLFVFVSFFLCTVLVWSVLGFEWLPGTLLVQAKEKEKCQPRMPYAVATRMPYI